VTPDPEENITVDAVDVLNTCDCAGGHRKDVEIDELRDVELRPDAD
jgi:hypothetical protein